MSIGGLLIRIVPFDCSIAIAGNKIFCVDGLPLKTSGRVPAQSWCIPYFKNISIVNIIDFNLTVWASSRNDFIIGIDLECKNFSADISKEID